MEPDQLSATAYRSVKWSVLANLLPRAVTPLVTIILAMILTPQDFGIVAGSTAIISIAQIVVELGAGAVVIQRRQQVHEIASMALWVSIILALLLWIGLWFAAPWLSQILGILQLSDVLRVASLGLFLAAMISVPNSLLVRDFEFKNIFWINSIPQIVIGLVSLLLAYFHLGYWSLVIGSLAGKLTNTILVWRYSMWRPRLVFNRTEFSGMLRFSSWVIVANIETWLFLYADNLLASYYLGVKSLGVYSLGFNLANLIPGFISASVASVAYPVLSVLQDNRENLRNGFIKIQSTTAVLIFPLCFGLSAISLPLINLIYGDRWPGLGMTIAFLAILPGLSHIWSLNADAYRAINRPDLWTKIAALSLLFIFFLLFLFGSKSLNHFVIARFVGAFSLPLLNIFLGGPRLHVSLGEQISGILFPLLCSVIMYICVLGLGRYLLPFYGWLGWGKLLGLILVGAGTYLLLLRLLKRELWDNLLLTAKRMLLPG